MKVKYTLLHKDKNTSGRYGTLEISDATREACELALKSNITFDILFMRIKNTYIIQLKQFGFY